MGDRNCDKIYEKNITNLSIDDIPELTLSEIIEILPEVADAHDMLCVRLSDNTSSV